MNAIRSLAHLVIGVLLAIGSAMPPSSSFAHATQAEPVQSAVAADRLQGGNLQSLPTAAQALISARLGRDSDTFHTVSIPGGFRLDNARHRIAANFTAERASFQSGPNTWGISLRSYGYTDDGAPLQIVAPQANANRVEYRRGSLTEWYENGPRGLEQGFTISTPPGKSRGHPLTIALTLSGNLAASLDERGRALILSRNGAPSLRYTGLTAADARGRDLHAWLEVTQDRLLLRVDDAGATFPLTIDPLVEAAKLTINDGTLPFLGVSAAISSDGKTVVVGAPEDFAFDPPLGAAYVFTESSNGWNDSTAVAKLTASDGASGDDFGFDVAISGSGNLIVVSAVRATIGSNQQQGAAYVFQKSGGVWADSTELVKLTPADGQAGSYFPGSIAVDKEGATLVLTGRFPGTGPSSLVSEFTGKAYVFVRPLTSIGWGSFGQAGTLTNSDQFYQISPCQNDPTVNCADGDEFGASTAISDDGSTIVVGATNTLPGKAYVYVKPSTGWVDTTETAKLTTSDGAYQFGSAAIDADASTIAIGALQAPFPRGAVYIYTRPATGWAAASETAKLNTAKTVNFLGFDVGISGDGRTVVAQADVGPGEDGIFLFVAPDTGWASGTETAVFPSAGFVDSGLALNGDGTALVIGRPDLNLVYVYTSSTESDFTLSPISPLAIGVGGSGSSTVTVNSFDGFSSAVSFSATGVPTGVTASAASVTPPAGGSATTQLKITIGPSVPQGTYMLELTGTSGSLSHPVPVDLMVTVTPASITNVITQEQALGCIDRSGISSSLEAKLAAAQADISAGLIQQAVNSLKALLNELQAQKGKHIASSCTDANGNTFDPGAVLIADVEALLASLGANANANADPITGNVVDAYGAGLPSITVRLISSPGTVVATAATDATGFYYFAANGGLKPGATYTAKVSVPKGYKDSSPSFQSFSWSASTVSLGNFSLK